MGVEPGVRRAEAPSLRQAALTRRAPPGAPQGGGAPHEGSSYRRCSEVCLGYFLRVGQIPLAAGGLRSPARDPVGDDLAQRWVASRTVAHGRSAAAAPPPGAAPPRRSQSRAVSRVCHSMRAPSGGGRRRARRRRIARGPTHAQLSGDDAPLGTPRAETSPSLLLRPAVSRTHVLRWDRGCAGGVLAWWRTSRVWGIPRVAAVPAPVVAALMALYLGVMAGPHLEGPSAGNALGSR